MLNSTVFWQIFNFAILIAFIGSWIWLIATVRSLYKKVSILEEKVNILLNKK